ncbi:MAG TPA: lectin [Xanthomonadaceae bacterium]|nr:lectin [Xanthomonadaceae bacterium]
MSRPLVLFVVLLLPLAACQQSTQEPAVAAPDAADAATADAQSTPVDSSANALPLKRPSATDVPMPGTAAMPAATVGATGYGALHFGMSRDEAERTAGAAFNGATSGSTCKQLRSPGQPEIAYLFEGDKLQRIDVKTPDVMADGGGHVGMQVEDIRTLYAGKLTELPHKYVKGGLYLKVAGKNGSGLVFETDASGKVTSFHAGIAPALDYVEGCS